MSAIGNFIAGSWKTKSSGILAVIGGVCMLVFAKVIDQAVIMASSTAILTGIGLIFARDNNKTSEDVGIQTPEKVARDGAAAPLIFGR